MREPVVGHSHAEDEEEHESRESVAVGNAADHDSDDHKGCAEKDSGIDREAAVHPKAYSVRVTARRSAMRAVPRRL